MTTAGQPVPGTARYDAALGRVPTMVARAFYDADSWLTTTDPAITTAIDAASDNTRKAWRADWSVFRRWAREPAARYWPDERDRLRLPVLPELLVAFVNDVASGSADGQPRHIATIRRYLSTLSALHRLLDLPDPTKAQIVRNTLKACARGSGGQKQALPLRWNLVEAASQALSHDLVGVRDSALLAVAHNTMARRAELVAIDLADLSFEDNGSGIAILRPTKTDLEAEEQYRYLSPFTTKLVKRWIERSELREGPLFVRLQANGQARVSNGQRGKCRQLLQHGQRLDAAQVAIIIKLAVATIALDRGELRLGDTDPASKRRAMLDYARGYSGHSARIGAAQDLAAAGISTAAILQSGGWKDERMVKRYIRRLASFEAGMAQMFAAQRRQEKMV